MPTPPAVRRHRGNREFFQSMFSPASFRSNEICSAGIQQCLSATTELTRKAARSPLESPLEGTCALGHFERFHEHNNRITTAGEDLINENLIPPSECRKNIINRELRS